MKPGGECSEMVLNRVGVFDGILRFSKSTRLRKFWLRFDSVDRRLVVTDAKEDEELSVSFGLK